MYLTSLFIFMSMFSLFLLNLLNSEKSPSKMIFSLILMTILLSMYMYTTMKKSWMSVSLFLAMVGGLMILFSLVSSIYPKSLNPSYKMSLSPLIIMIIMSVTPTINFNINSNPIKTFHFKMEFIMLIILILNMMLIFISKMMISPMKPFRSI